MAQLTSGLYRLTQFPTFYLGLQTALGSHRSRSQISELYIRPSPGCSILDLGCGPASMLPYLGNCGYTGIDLNPDHIAVARRLSSPGATLIVGDAQSASTLPEAAFDRVTALGLLHHLDDDQVRDLAQIIRRRLRPNGFFVAVDPTFAPGQHWIARRLAKADSGQNVRPPHDYGRLVEHELPRVSTIVRHDLIRIPYSHAITIAEAAP